MPELVQNADQNASSSRLSRMRVLVCFSSDLSKSSFVRNPLLPHSSALPYSIQVRQQQLHRQV
jgi:hypothetical protein